MKREEMLLQAIFAPYNPFENADKNEIYSPCLSLQP